MERVETLLKKLQEQFAEKATPEQLLLTVQMLQAELLHLQTSHAQPYSGDNIAVVVSPINDPKNIPDKPAIPEEKIVEVLKVDEAEIEAELEEIKRNAEAIQKISQQNKPHILYQGEEDIPTLSHQNQLKTGDTTSKPESDKKEINETAANNVSSINERLKQSKIDLGDALTEVPIRDLRKAIAVNDRFLFINELFRGDEAMYERSIKTINGFSIYPEAEYWIQRELKVKNGWNDSDEMVKQFYQLVKRRFS